MRIRLALGHDTKQVLELFDKYLSEDNDAIYSDEFLCSLGVKGAIKRGQLVVAVEHGHVVGAARFYRRKRNNSISLYQFAVDASHRGKRLLMDMLDLIRDSRIIARCPVRSCFNNYYRRTGWVLDRSDTQYNYWFLPPKSHE